MIGVQNLDVRRHVDLAGRHRAGARGAQSHALGTFGVHTQRQLLDVQDDVDHVFAHAFQRRELMDHAVDLDGGDRRALQRGQQNATQRVAERHAEATLEGLGHQARLALGVGAGLDLGLLGTDQLLPVSFDHFVPRTGFVGSGLVDEAMVEPTEMGCAWNEVAIRRDDAWADGNRYAASA